MNSFYGGRSGAPFVISKAYPTVKAMSDAFAQGVSYTGVKYGEYVLINTEDKNNPDNGKLFRRDFYNTANDIKITHYPGEKNEAGIYIGENISAYGAVLIGTIVGPTGAAPHFKPVPYSQDIPKIDENGEVIEGEFETITYTLDDLKEEYAAYDTTSGYGAFQPNVEDINLLPGKIEDEEGNHIYRDIIDWESYSVRTPNADDTTVFMDLKLTYPVIEFDAETKDAYYNRNDNGTTNTFDNIELVDSVPAQDGKKHPFYQKWKINVPKGIHGASVENLRVDVDEENRAILKYEIRNYDAIAEGQTASVVLGDYNMIDNIELANDGTFTIQYSHDDDYIRQGNDRLTWIESSSYNKETGLLSIDLNNDVEGRQKNTRIEMKSAADILVEDGNKLVLQYNTIDPATNLPHTKDLGRFVYLGANEPADLSIGGLWIETEEV